MTEREYDIKAASDGVVKAAAEVRKAKIELEGAFKQGQARMLEMTAKNEQEYSLLKEKVLKAEADLETHKAYLEYKNAVTFN